MDSLYINSRLRVRRQVVTHIRRQLPATGGKFHVAVGQEVAPGDILGEGCTPVGFRTIRLTDDLGVGAGEAMQYLKRKIGQTIFTGELLAEKKNLFGLGKKLLLSPVDGVVDFYDNREGNLRIKLTPRPVKLISGVYGVVDGVDLKNDVVIIRTLASTIYGVLGSGREREGILKVIGSAEELISSKQIGSGLRGNIVIGGGMVFLEALQRAVELQIAGLVSGGINAVDYRQMRGGALGIYQRDWSDVGLTLMVTEGFGSVPIGEDIFSLLKEHQGKIAILDGNRAQLILPINNQSSMIDIRRHRLPLGVVSQDGPETGTLMLQGGMMVRVVGEPGMGFEGKVETIDRSLTELPSGVKTYLVNVVGRRQKLRVPYQNLEAIG